MNRKQYYLKLRQEWKARINNWRTSKKSGAQWCRENNIKTDIFYYWSNKFSHLKPYEKETCKFIEIPKEKLQEHIGIEICHENIFLRLSKDFDESSLCRILKVLQGI